MTGEPQIVIIGNLTQEVELRFTAAGAAVANMTIASTPRTFNKQSNEWVDGETLFLRASIWREAAENAAETLAKGMRVIAVGALKARSYDTKEGDKRTVMELDLEEIAPSLRYASAKVQRTQRGNGEGAAGRGQQQYQQGGQQGGAWSPTPAPDQGQQGQQWGGQQSNPAGGWG